MTKRLFLPDLNYIFDYFQSFDNLYSNDAAEKLSHYNIEEDNKSYYINIDMPGVRKEDLDIGIKENILSISAERKKAVKTESGDLKEETVSSYEQSFNINSKGIDIENIEADLNNGVLKVTLPKKEELKYERKIEIKGA